MEELFWLLCFWAGVVFSLPVMSVAVRAGLLPARKMLEFPLFFLSALLPSTPRFRWKSLGFEAWSLEKELSNEPGQA